MCQSNMSGSTGSVSGLDDTLWKCVILVCDDDRPLLDIFSRHLPRYGWKVLTAPDGLRALQILDAQSVDAVVVDERMPGPAGAALLEHVHATWPEMRLVLLSGWPSVEGRERAQAIGARVVTKGAEFGELLEAIGGPCG
jgi:DNA-binding response OmpR family regulator